MPQFIKEYNTSDEVPADLKQFVLPGTNKVSIWYGDKVAEETNSGLIKNRDDMKAERDGFELKYKALVETSSKDDVTMARKVADLELKVQAGAKISDEDQKILDAVKSVKEVEISPEYLTEAVKNYKPTAERLATIEKTQLDSEFFKATGFKNEKAFLKAIADKEANPNLVKYYSEKTNEAGNEVVKTYADVKLADGTTSKVPFNDYLEKHADWSIYKPAILGTDQQTWIAATQNSQTSNTSVSKTGNGLPSNNYLDSVQQGFEVANKPKEPANAAK